MTERPGADAVRLGEALAGYASGVTLVTIADGRDDIGLTVSAFCPVSLEPPLVLVALRAESYPAEVLARPDGPAGSPSRCWRPASGCWPAGSRRPGGRARGCCSTACRSARPPGRAR